MSRSAAGAGGEGAGEFSRDRPARGGEGLLGRAQNLPCGPAVAGGGPDQGRDLDRVVGHECKCPSGFRGIRRFPQGA